MCRSQNPPITVMCCSQNTPTMLPLGCEGTGWGWCINIIILHIPKTHSVGEKKKKKKCVCDNKIRPRWINCDAFHYADRFLLPVQSPGAVLYFEGDPVGSTAPDKIGLSQRSRCPCANYCKFAHVKVWNLSIKPFSVLNIAFKAAPKE